MKRTWSWSPDELLVWRSWGCLEERLDQLCDPRLLRLPPKTGDLIKALIDLCEAVPRQVARLAVLSCLAALIGRKGQDGRKTVREVLRAIPPSLVDLPPRGHDLDQVRWSVVPIPLAAAGRGEILWALVGTSPNATGEPFPGWCRRILDSEAAEALGVAGRLLDEGHGQGLFVAPLIQPEANTWTADQPRRIYGPSLALPVLLGALEALRGKAVPLQSGGAAATGALDVTGRVLGVGQLEAKAEAAARAGFRFLIVPEGAPPASGRSIELLEARNLDAAHYLWESCRRYPRPGRLEDLERLRSPAELAAGVHLLDHRLAGWSGFASSYRRGLHGVWNDPDHVRDLVGRLERMSRDPQVPAHWLEALLEPVDEAVAARVAETSPALAFRLVQCVWAAATRRGDPGEASRWAAYCESLCETVVLHEKGLDLVADFWNRRIVTERHGLYRFDPNLPAPVEEILGKLETARAARSMGAKVPVSPSLGKLYGTLAQNYGFCGPAYLAETRRLVAQAQDAFGGQGVGEKEYDRDRRRQLHYLVYALLDAARRDEADAVLHRYLEGSTEGGLGPYQHAAMARVGAETGKMPSEYQAVCTRLLQKDLAGHPWQLWLWNVGRLLDEREEKRRAWKRGLKLCKDLGPTGRPMGLLHAAWLWREGLAGREDIEKEVETILAEVQRGPLCQEHFRPLITARSWSQVLDQILNAPQRFFPFTYR